MPNLRYKTATAFRFFLWELFSIKSKPLSLLVHENGKIRESARNTLNRIDPLWPQGKDARGLVPEFIVALRAKDQYVRKVAAEILGLIRDDRALDALIIALNDKKSVVREAAAKSLGMIGNKNATDSLIETTKDEVEEVAIAAARALGKIGDTRAVGRLTEFLNEGKNPVAAAIALGLIGDTQAVKLLINALEKDKASLRKEAARSLGMIGDTRAVGPLIGAMKDNNSDVRMAAIEALGMLGDERAVDPLMSILDKDILKKWGKKFETDADVDLTFIETACVAAIALGGTGNIRAVPLLLDLKKMGFYGFIPPSVGEAAQKALSQMVDRSDSQYDHPYCAKCCRRTKCMEVPPTVGGPIKPVVYCPKCGDSRRLLSGIKKAVGVIGGNCAELLREGDTLTVPLWNERDKKIKFADIDTLEIREGGIDNFHLAVNSVILEYSAIVSLIPLRIVGNPQLPNSVIRMIEDNFNSIKTDDLGNNT